MDEIRSADDLPAAATGCGGCLGGALLVGLGLLLGLGMLAAVITNSADSGTHTERVIGGIVAGLIVMCGLFWSLVSADRHRDARDARRMHPELTSPPKPCGPCSLGLHGGCAGGDCPCAVQQHRWHPT